MKLLLTILLPLLLVLGSSAGYAQSKEIDIAGTWGRDDSKIRTIEYVSGGIKMTTEDDVYFYKKIGVNKYQMEWTPSIYDGNYRWTMTVIDENLFETLYEKDNGSKGSIREYRRFLA